MLFVGYQAGGTRGARMLEGEPEIKIHGKYVRVKAQVDKLDGLSAHADYSEMLRWLQASEGLAHGGADDDAGVQAIASSALHARGVKISHSGAEKARCRV